MAGLRVTLIVQFGVVPSTDTSIKVSIDLSTITGPSIDTLPLITPETVVRLRVKRMCLGVTLQGRSQMHE